MVFLKLPELWKDAENLRIVDDQVNKFLRDTTKVVAVELFATGFRIEDGVAGPIVSGGEVINLNHKFDPSLDWSLIENAAPQPVDFIPPPWWRSIYGLIDPTVDPRRWQP